MNEKGKSMTGASIRILASLMLGCIGVMVKCIGLVVLRFCGFVALWFCGFVILRFTVAFFYPCTMLMMVS